MSLLSISSTVTATPQASITPARPAGAGATHILLAYVERLATAGGFMTAATGWTLVTQFQSSDFTIQVQLWRALGDVATLVFTVPTATSDMKAVVAAFSGRNLTTPITDSNSASSVGTTISQPSMTAVSGDDAFVVWVDAQNSASLGSPPASYTDQFNNAAISHTIASTREGLTAGATGALTRTCANFTAKTAIGALVAAAGSGGTTTLMGTRIFVNG